MEESNDQGARDTDAGGPAQLRSLLAHASRLPGDLEAAWSRALIQADLQTGLESLQIRFDAALKAFFEFHQSHETESGLATNLPLDDDDWVAVSGSRVSTSDLRTVAQITVFRLLVSAFAGLRAPGIEVVNLVTSESESVWKADAFSRFRFTTGWLNDLLAEERTSLEEALRLLELAQRAANLGMPEATVIYLRLALPELSKVLADADEDGADHVSDNNQDPFLEELGWPAAAANLVTACCEAIASGTRPDLATVSLLATEITDQLIQLVNTRLFGGTA